MTTSEIAWLATGINAGATLTMFIFLVGNSVEARRDLAAVEASLSHARKLEATSGWHEILTRRNLS